MSDTHFILTGVLTLIAMGIAILIVYHFTRSFGMMTMTSFVVGEIGFVILAMNSEGLFLWFCVIFLIPIAHLTALATYSHRYNNGNSSIREERKCKTD